MTVAQGIQEKIKSAAVSTALEFFKEFQEVLDPAKTDWEAVSWEHEELDLPDDIDSDECFGIYSEALIAETERLFENFKSSFEVQSDDFDEKAETGWSIQVQGWEDEGSAYEGSSDEAFRSVCRPWPQLLCSAWNYFRECYEEVREFEDEYGVICQEKEWIEDDPYSTCPTDEQIIAALPVLPTDKIYRIGGWDRGEEKIVVCKITIADRPHREVLAFETAAACGLEVITP